MTRIVALIFSFGLSLAVLQGCSSNTDRMLGQAFGYKCETAESTVGGWVCSENDASVASVSRYCYETLGTVNCLDRPDPDRYNQTQGTTGY